MYESILQHSMDINKEKSFIKYGLEHKKYCVLTLHREENVSDLNKLMTIVKALSGLDIKIIFPCHPRTKQKLDKHGLKTTFELLKPLPYYEMLSLVQGAGAVITDSGGLQKEAYWLGTPCVTLRDSTEWVETIRSGANCLVDSNPDKIVTGVKTALKNGFQDNGSDNGLLIRDASQKILDDILKFWGMNYD
jgi:UDP-N-acetylglucosamine 2-epimerase